MKSTLIVLLLVLASYCYSGALACESLEKIKTIGLFKSNDELRKEFSKYTSDPDAINAGIKAKACGNVLSFFDKIAVFYALTKGWKDC